MREVEVRAEQIQLSELRIPTRAELKEKTRNAWVQVLEYVRKFREKSTRITPEATSASVSVQTFLTQIQLFSTSSVTLKKSFQTAFSNLIQNDLECYLY